MGESVEPLDYISDKFKNDLDLCLRTNKTINFQTYVLGDSGEARLKYIIDKLVEKYQRIELTELLYTAAKELVVNCTKAAIKRIIFYEKGISLEDEESQEKVMAEFKESLTDKKFPHFRESMKKMNLKANVLFLHNQERIIMKVINNFKMLPKEEKRIREKFLNAKKFDNLFEFYMAHGDNTEGAGMGITLVEILLLQMGYDRHLFTIYTNGVSTVAKLEIPLSESYKPKRVIFEELLKTSGKSVEELRKEFKKE